MLIVLVALALAFRRLPQEALDAQNFSGWENIHLVMH
jgi:hypothetical protein